MALKACAYRKKGDKDFASSVSLTSHAIADPLGRICYLIFSATGRVGRREGANAERCVFGNLNASTSCQGHHSRLVLCTAAVTDSGTAVVPLCFVCFRAVFVFVCHLVCAALGLEVPQQFHPRESQGVCDSRVPVYIHARMVYQVRGKLQFNTRDAAKKIPRNHMIRQQNRKPRSTDGL